MTPSKYQEAIYKAVKDETGNFMVEAVAGSGKTSTIKSSLKLIPRMTNVLFLAFNKHIADELKKDIPGNVEAATLNSLGWRMCTRAFGKIELNEKKSWLIAKGMGVPYEWLGALSKIVSLMKATVRVLHDEAMLTAPADLAEAFDVELPRETHAFTSKCHEVLVKSISMTSMMDFDDQIFMPVYLNLPGNKYDVVMVDEAQDLSAAQIELVAKVARRVIAVGDPYQSIYGFRGACPDAMDNIGTRFNMKRLPLSICYRCPDSHVELAKEIVGHIEGCGRTGSVGSIDVSDLWQEAKSGDYVLCRTTAPLVKHCMRLIARNIKATVKGRDIGKQLESFIAKLAAPSSLVTDFLPVLETWVANEKTRLASMDRDTQPLEDRYETVCVLSEGCSVVQDILTKINNIFTDSATGVVFCTVHRAKGLEGERIFLLRPELMPFPKAKKAWQIQQEMNLRYVALTRSKRDLIFLEGE